MAMICPACGNMIGYNSYFSAFYCPRCGGIFKKVEPMANADRIRSMSDEELEEGIGRLSLGYQPWCDHHCKVNGDYNCNRCLRIWPQQPAEED